MVTCSYILFSLPVLKNLEAPLKYSRRGAGRRRRRRRRRRRKRKRRMKKRRKREGGGRS